MKTTIEVNGYEIVIEDMDGTLSVSATKDGEVMEEFSISSETESEDMNDSEDVQGFDEFSDESEEEDFDGEEEDFDGGEESEEEEEEEESEEDESEESEEEETEEETKLESFNSFFKKKRK